MHYQNTVVDCETGPTLTARRHMTPRFVEREKCCVGLGRAGSHSTTAKEVRKELENNDSSKQFLMLAMASTLCLGDKYSLVNSGLILQ